jgi:type VI secretion system protein ImpG
MARLPKSGVGSLFAAAERLAEAQPALAGSLARTSNDPSLERVREGLFYLGATIVDQIRELELDGFRAIADVVAPALARPFPAATVIELSVAEGPVERVLAGAEVTSRGSLSCRFRTVSDVDVGPVRIDGLRLGEQGSLRFELIAGGQAPRAAAVGDRLRLFVEGPRDSSLLLVAHALAHGGRAELSFEGGTGAVRVEGYGLGADDVLAPEPDGPSTGLALLREYFLLPEKFAFLELRGIPAALSGSRADRATVTLSFDAPLPPRASLAGGRLRPNCTPAVNLFPATSEPRVFRPGRSQFPVRVAGLSRDHGGVYAVLSASALVCSGAADPIRLPPLRRFGAAQLGAAFPYAYSVKVVASTMHDEPDVFVAICSPRGARTVSEPHVVSLELLATNRDRASMVLPGELVDAGLGMPSRVHLRNVVATSPYVPPAAGLELALQTLAQTAIPGADPLFSLKSLLFASVPRARVAAAVLRANLARIDALERLQIGVGVDQGRTRRGYVASFELDDSHFDGLGDVALFVRLLHHALEAQSSVNHFYRCNAVCTKSGARLRWPPGGDA